MLKPVKESFFTYKKIKVESFFRILQCFKVKIHHLSSSSSSFFLVIGNANNCYHYSAEFDNTDIFLLFLIPLIDV